MLRVLIRESASGRFHLAGFGISIGGANRRRVFVVIVLDRGGNIIMKSHPTTALDLGIAARGRGDYDNDNFHQADIVVRDRTGAVVPHSAIGRRIPWR